MSGGARIVEYGLPQRLLGMSVILILLYLVTREFRNEESKRLFFGLWLLPILVLVSVFTVHVWVAKIRFYRESIEVISPWRRRRVVPFSKVRVVRAGMAGWTVQTAGYGSIRFNHLQRG